jgi:hypothetical protein
MKLCHLQKKNEGDRDHCVKQNKPYIYKLSYMVARPIKQNKTRL